MEKSRGEALWELSKQVLPQRYFLTSHEAVVLMKRDEDMNIPFLFNGEGQIQAFQSHSDRCAWLYQPIEIGGRWYPGYEYKGVGLKGGPIELRDDRLWGGVEYLRGKAEHEFTTMALQSGALVQIPLALYRMGTIHGQEAVVFVRTYQSRLRLIDFKKDSQILQHYLEITGETSMTYAGRLGVTLGKSTKCLFDHHWGKDTFEIDNVSSEGELLDFERLCVSEERETKTQCYSLRVFFREMQRLFKMDRVFHPVLDRWWSVPFGDELFQHFLDAFNTALVGSPLPLSQDPGRASVEAYLKRKLTEEELTFRYEEPIQKRLEEGVKLLNEAKEELERQKEPMEAERELLHVVNHLLEDLTLTC